MRKEIVSEARQRILDLSSFHLNPLQGIHDGMLAMHASSLCGNCCWEVEDSDFPHYRNISIIGIVSVQMIASVILGNYWQ